MESKYYVQAVSHGSCLGREYHTLLVMVLSPAQASAKAAALKRITKMEKELQQNFPKDGDVRVLLAYQQRARDYLRPLEKAFAGITGRLEWHEFLKGDYEINQVLGRLPELSRKV